MTTKLNRDTIIAMLQADIDLDRVRCRQLIGLIQQDVRFLTEETDGLVALESYIPVGSLESLAARAQTLVKLVHDLHATEKMLDIAQRLA